MQPGQSPPALSRAQFVALILLTGFALLTRFWGLAEWPLRHDEGHTVLRGAGRLWTLTNPAYYWLTAITSRIFSDVEFGYRLPTALFGAAAIPLFALTWRRIIGNRAALFGATVVLLSSWHLYHSQYARFYACVFLIASLAYYLYLRALEKDSVPLLIGSIAMGALAALFHATAAMVVAWCFVFTLLCRWGPARFRTGISPKLVRVHLIVAGIGAVVAIPVLWKILAGWSEGGLAAPGPVTWGLRFIRAAGVPELVLAAVGWFFLLQLNRRVALFVAVAVGFTVAAALLGSAVIGMRNDYVFSMVPLLAVCAGIFLDQITSRLSGATGGAVAALLLLLLLPAFISHYMERLSLDVRDVVAEVQRQYRPGDRVVSLSGEFRYYAPPDMKLELLPDLRDRYIRHAPEDAGGWKAVLEPLLQSKGRTWLVLRQERTPLHPAIQRWLGENARLRWRKSAQRLDEEIESYEIWLVDPPGCGPEPASATIK